VSGDRIWNLRVRTQTTNKAKLNENNKDLPLRNSAIIESLKDGYTQGEIERYLTWMCLLPWFLMFLGVIIISGLCTDPKFQ
jgi:hypothetical protein